MSNQMSVTGTEKNLSSEVEGKSKFVCYNLQANFFTANIEIKKKILRGLRVYLFTDEISFKACSLEPYLTVLVFYFCL